MKKEEKNAIIIAKIIKGIFIILTAICIIIATIQFFKCCDAGINFNREAGYEYMMGWIFSTGIAFEFGYIADYIGKSIKRYIRKIEKRR